MIWRLARDCGNSFMPDLYKGLREGNGCKVKIDDIGDAITVFANVIQGLLALAGILATVFIIIGAIQYVISLGEPARTVKAKETIFYAVLGLVIILSAYGIVEFISRNYIG